MEFWGVEIKSGESLVVENEGDKMLHLSQACLSEVKKNKGAEPVYLFAKVGDQKFVLGILSSDKTPRVTFDLVFKKKFELSHTWKNGSVHFLGYKGSEDQHDGGPDSESDTDSDYSEDDIVPIPNAGTSTLQAKKEVKGANLNNDIKSDVKGSADNDEDDESSEESSDDEQAKVKKEEEEISDDELESDDEESDDSEEDEKVVEKKVDTSKKRPAKAATKTSIKKAKLVTPEKSGGKTGGNNVAHVATPYPTRQAAKIAAKSDQPTQQTPNTARAFACKSCDKSFGSDVALQSHTKAKHANGN